MIDRIDEIRKQLEAAQAAPECAVCKMRKPPVGRSVALEMANGMCDSACPGYRQEPQPGWEWPGEDTDIAYLLRLVEELELSVRAGATNGLQVIAAARKRAEGK